MARPRPSLSGVRHAGAIAGAILACLAGCQGDLVNLGNSAPLVTGGDSGFGGAGAGAVAGTGAAGGAAVEWIRIDEPVLIEDETHALANPALPRSMDYMLFTRQQRGEPDPHIWRAERRADGSFSKPDFENAMPLELGEDTNNGASSPALNAAGDELWFGMGLTGSSDATDVYVALADGDGWGTPQRVDELSSEHDDSPRPPGQGGLVMPLSSKRHGGKLYQIYFSTRDASGTWQTPSQDYLETINVADTTSVDGFLTDDGRTLYFAAARVSPESADLYRARRLDIDQPFGEPAPLRDLNTGSDERDPWLSEDGEWLYYSSNRTGFYAIYRARRAQP